MDNQKEWNEFLENLFSSALKKYQDTKEFEFLKEKHEQLDVQLFESYPEEKNPLVYEFAFEIGLDEERKNGFFYRQ